MQTRSVNCPTCQKEVLWIEKNNHRPFCSERCKLIDFGDWANGNHAIPGEPVLDPDSESDDFQHLLED